MSGAATVADDDDTARHCAQLARDYLAAIWAGNHDAADIVRAELERLERRTQRQQTRDATQPA